MKDNALYLEADEDITSAIDKLKKSAGNSVQIVVPKRSTMLQSIINLKLLKKAAESAGKELVLVTNDRIAGELAARVGLAVAPSLGAKPVIKEAEMPEDLAAGEEVIEADDPEPPSTPEPTPSPAKKKPLAFKSKEVGSEPPAPDPDADDVPDAAPVASPKNAKKRPKVPNFSLLQRRAMWIGLAAFLVIGYVLAMYFLTSAKVVLYANGTKSDIDTTFTVDPSAKQTDSAGGTLAGQTVTVSKDLSGPFTPTGKKDAGTKATGSMTIVNSDPGSAHDLVAGTRFTAPDGKVFRLDADTHVDAAQPKICGFQFCTQPSQVSATVTADQNGDSYNEAPAKYTIPGLSSSQQQVTYGQGAQMSGGTSKIVTVVQQSDVDGAKSDLLDKDKDNAGRDLKGKVPSGYMALDASQVTNVTAVNPAPAVGAEGDTATLTLKVTYTVLAVKQSDYQAVVDAQEQKQIGNSNQIYDDGMSNAQVTATDKDSSGRQTFHFTAEAYSGTKLDTKAIATQLAGKRFGDAADAAKRYPGVSDASISLWPGWATNLPSRSGKIQVKIQITNKQ